MFRVFLNTLGVYVKDIFSIFTSFILGMLFLVFVVPIYLGIILLAVMAFILIFPLFAVKCKSEKFDDKYYDFYLLFFEILDNVFFFIKHKICNRKKKNDN